MWRWFNDVRLIEIPGTASGKGINDNGKDQPDKNPENPGDLIFT